MAKIKKEEHVKKSDELETIMTPMSKATLYTGRILGWVFGVLLIVLSLSLLLQSPIAAISLILSALLILPPLHQYLSFIPVSKRIGLALVILVGGIMTASLVGINQLEKQERQEQALAAAQERQKRADEFTAMRGDILTRLEDLTGQEKYAEALSISKQYADLGDQELMGFHTLAAQKVEEQRKAAELTKLKADYKQNRDDLLPRMGEFFGKNAADLQAVMREAGQYLSIADNAFIKAYEKLEAEYDKRYAEEQKREAKRQAEEKRRQELVSMNVGKAKLEAFTHCQLLMKQSLKAPSSAKFAWYDEDMVNISDDHEIFKVRAYVDAQNSFGAMLRTNYVCKLQYNGGGTGGWNLVEFYTRD